MKQITLNELKRLTHAEGLILQGCGGDLQEWVDGINKNFAGVPDGNGGIITA